MSKTVVGDLQLGFRFSSPFPLHYQAGDQQRLDQDQSGPSKEVPPVELPRRQLAVQNDAADRKIPFVQSPVIERAPIEDKFVRSLGNRNVAGFHSIKNLQDRITRNRPLRLN